MITELAGGIGIYNETLGNAYFSMAACGNYRSNLSILSCGHGIQAVGDIIRYQSATGDVIGTVTYHRYENDMYGDFEFISVDASKFSLSNDIASGHSITGTNPAVNTIVKVYGSASDYVSYGVIEERGCVITPDEGTSRETTIRGMTKIKFQDGNITNGDSGGTVFVEGTNGIQFCGAISSKYELYGFPYVYFTPYTYISAAGFTVKIN